MNSGRELEPDVLAIFYQKQNRRINTKYNKIVLINTSCRIVQISQHLSNKIYIHWFLKHTTVSIYCCYSVFVEISNSLSKIHFAINFFPNPSGFFILRVTIIRIIIIIIIIIIKLLSSVLVAYVSTSASLLFQMLKALQKLPLSVCINPAHTADR